MMNRLTTYIAIVGLSLAGAACQSSNGSARFGSRSGYDNDSYVQPRSTDKTPSANANNNLSGSSNSASVSTPSDVGNLGRPDASGTSASSNNSSSNNASNGNASSSNSAANNPSAPGNINPGSNTNSGSNSSTGSSANENR